MDEVTATYLVSKPTEEMMSVTGKEGTVILNSPLSLVKTPADEPFTVTETAGSDSPVLVPLTLPFMVTDCA